MAFLLIWAIFTASFSQPGNEAIGWASYGEVVTGGGDHPGIRVFNREQFLEAIKQPNRVILVEDTINLIDGERVDILADHMTIEGSGEGGMLRNGGIKIFGNNIIVRNLSIGDSYRNGEWSGKGGPTTDAITLYGTHIWIDHCELFHSFDGLLDVSSQAGESTGDLITVSWTRFYNHNKVMLIGSNDRCRACRGKHRVTVHHCWFDGASTFYDPVDLKYYRVQQRMPRVRYGDVHVFNNYYENVADYAVAARFESRLYVEDNYFRNLRDPHIIRDQGRGQRDPELYATGNLYDHVSGERASSGDSFLPGEFYVYESDPVLELPSLVMNHAGKINPENNTPPIAEQDTFYIQPGKDHALNPLENDCDPDSDSIRIALVVAQDGLNVTTYADHLLCSSDDPGTYRIDYQIIDYRGGAAEGIAVVVVQQ